MLYLLSKKALLQQVSSKFKERVKKLVTVLATFTLVTVARMGAVNENLGSNLAQVPCIQYSINCRKKSMWELFDSDSKVNTIHPTFAKESSLSIRPTDIKVQKIHGIMLDTFGMVVAAFSMTNKANQVRFFKEIFLVANVSPELILRMLFFILSGVNIDFLRHELWWGTYTIEEALPTTRCVELVGKKEFATTALDSEHETYVVHVGLVNSNALPSSSPFNIHPFCRPQIASMIAEKAFTKVSTKYLDFADIFLSNLASKLPKHTGINNHAIKLVNGQQPPYGPIYSLGPVELETLKAYIKINLANRFIRLSKFPTNALILFE